jgi:hypothetical protein
MERLRSPGAQAHKKVFYQRNLETPTDARRGTQILRSPENFSATNNAPPGRIQNGSNVAANTHNFPAVDATEQNRNCLRFGYKVPSNGATSLEKKTYFILPFTRIENPK